MRGRSFDLHALSGYSGPVSARLLDNMLLIRTGAYAKSHYDPPKDDPNVNVPSVVASISETRRALQKSNGRNDD